MINEMMNSQPKVRLSKVVLMLCLSAAIVMGTMPCVPFVTTARADNAEKTIACIGADILSKNCADVGAAKVYYGKYYDEELAWRVINYDGDGALFNGNENNLTLFAGGLIGYSRFSEGRDRNNKYGDSELKTEIDNIYSAYFTEKEKGAIKKRELYSGNCDGLNTDCISGNSLTGEDAPYLWPLSAKEANVIKTNVENDDDNYLKATYDWWLRSPGPEIVSAMNVSGDGKIRVDGDDDVDVSGHFYGVRPAFNIGLDSVISTSLVSGTKGEPGAEYKLTIPDSDLSVSVNNVSKSNDNKFTVDYTITDNSSIDPTQLSVLITDGHTTWTDNGWSCSQLGGNISYLQYTKLDVGSFGLSGTGTFTLGSSISGTWGRDYHVYILAEDVNGGHETDYASPPVEILDPSAVWASAADQEFTYDGQPHGITVNVSNPKNGVTVTYGESADNCTLNTSPTITNVSESPKTIYYKAEAGGFTTAAGSATVTINKAESAITKAPSAISGLKYTGEEQALVNAGTATGGTLYYAVTTGTAAPDGSAYTETVPQKTDAGTYYVWYKVTGDGNHKDVAPDSVSVTIKQAESAITKAPSAKTGLKYTGQAQALVNAGTATGGTLYYAVTTGTAAPAGSAYTETVPQKTNAGTYYVWYKVTGGGNYEDIDPDSVSVTIKQAESAITKAPSAISGLKYTGQAQALVNAGTATGGTLYYAVTTGTAAPAGSAYTAAVPKKTDAGTYYVWYKVNGGGNYEDIDPDSVSVTIKQAESAITKAPSAISGLKYTGQAQALVNAGTATGGTLYYAVTTENTAPAGSAYTAAVPKKTDAGTYYVWYKVNGGGNYEDIDPDSVSVTIKQAESAITKAPSAISGLKYTGQAQALVNAGTATGGKLHYAVTTENTAPAETAYTEAVPGKTDAGTYYVWYKVNGGRNYEDVAPDSVSVTINKADPVITKAPSEISGLKYTGEEQALVNAGTATGGTLYYAVTTENTAPAGTAYTEAVPEKTDAGTYYVWYKVMGDGNYKDSNPDSVSVTIDKADSVITKAPSAISGLKYTGRTQALVNAGTVTGGTMYYAVTTENTAPDGSAYTAAVPQKTDAGTYYVWYKVNGDANHEDIISSSVSVTIAEEDKPDEPEREAGKPVLIKATSDAISVKAEEGVEYSVDGGNNWNTTGIFKDLQQDTEYSIIARYAASGGKEAGKPSEALTVRTLKIVENTVSTKTLSVSGNEIKVETVLSSEESTEGESYSVGQVEIPDDVAVSLFNGLSEEDQQRVAEGEKFTISISVKESIIDMENKDLKDNKEKADKEIKEKTGGTVEATGMMLDIGLLVQIGESDKKKTEPTQGSGKITFTVTVPVDMKNTDDSVIRTYYLIHILDDGTVEIVNSGTGTEIPAETDSFSYWYLTYVDEKKEEEKKEEEKKDDEGGSGNPSSEKVITVYDNEPLAYSEETKGDFRIGYCHEIPFFGKAKPDITLFGDIKVFYNGVAYKAVKIKVNKKKGLIQITGLDIADKDILKAVKKATKGSAGLPFKINPYYVKDTDTVTPKYRKDGSLKSVKVRIRDKDYKAKKGEFSYDRDSKTVSFDGNNLKGSHKLP